MRFAFTDDQLALRDAVADLLDKECPADAVRSAWTNADGRSGCWPALAEMGVAGLQVPDDVGGLGLSELEMVLVCEAAGDHALPEPVVDTAAVVAPLLAEARDGRVGALVESGATAAVVSPLDEHAVWADSAGLVAVFDAGGVHVVERHQAVLEPRPSVDGARRLSWVDADVSDATRVGGPDEAARALDRGALATAAVQLGLARRMLAMTVEYVSEREQFGVPVGSFQAVKHHLADARLRLEFAAPLVYRAAWSLAHDEPGRSTHVSMAKVHADEAAALTARAALQCHGAIGYTTEHDLHLWMKRSWALGRSWGDAGWHVRRVGDAMLS